jgi:hypothetical protein
MAASYRNPTQEIYELLRKDTHTETCNGARERQCLCIRNRQARAARGITSRGAFFLFKRYGQGLIRIIRNHISISPLHERYIFLAFLISDSPFDSTRLSSDTDSNVPALRFER